MIKHLFSALIALGLSLAVYLYFYLGFYKPVEIAIDQRGPLHFLYKAHTGPYHTIGPVISEVEKWALENKVGCEKTYGEYIDNPDAVDQDRLRSHGGCVLPGPLPAGFVSPYTYEVRDEKNYVVARFEGSPSIGPFKVYPKAVRYIEDHHLKVGEAIIETYLIQGTAVTTEIMFPILPSAAAAVTF